jgi:hypothetical protein
MPSLSLGGELNVVRVLSGRVKNALMPDAALANDEKNPTNVIVGLSLYL